MNGHPDLLATVDCSVGIYGWAPTCYLSSLARLDAFTIADLNAAIEVERSLVRVRAMRYSVYCFPHDLLAVALAATGAESLRAVEQRAKRLGDSYPALARQVESVLADGPLPAADIRQAVDPDRKLGSNFNLVLGKLAAEFRIVRAVSSGSWRSNRLTYARWQDWLPEVDPRSLDPDEAKRRLAQRYVAAYGPVKLEDLRWWTGWSKTAARAAAEGLDLSAPGGAAALLDGVRLLPVWDALMVAYRNRERLLDPEHVRFVYDRLGNATSVVLAGGRVVGVWDLGGTDDPLATKVAPFGDWTQRRWDAVEAQAARIGEMIGAGAVEVIRRDAPVDLLEAPRNRFLSPLSD